MQKVICYYRVSTAEQGRSGLGLEAQRAVVARFLGWRHCRVVAEFEEVDSGGKNDRPLLAQAIDLAEITGASILVAEQSRLTRDEDLPGILRQRGVRFIDATNPDANPLMQGLNTVMNADERRKISDRTRAALAAAKARGQRLGNPNGAASLQRAGKGNVAAVATVKARAATFAEKRRPIVAAIRAEGITSLNGIAAALNERGIQPARAGGEWSASSVRNLLARLDNPA